MESENEKNLMNEENFWRILLRNTYDSVERKGDRLKNLLVKFYEGKKHQVKEYYDSQEEFIVELSQQSLETQKKRLFTIWARAVWDRNSSGVSMYSQGEPSESMQAIVGKVAHEELEDGFHLFWPSKKRTLITETESGILAEQFKHAYPVIIRVVENEIEIRGSKARVKTFIKAAEGTEDISVSEPKEVTKEIQTSLQNVITKQSDILRLTDIKFQSSNLPNRSSVAISNNQGVLIDVQTPEFKSIVGEHSLIDVEEFRFTYVPVQKTVILQKKEQEEGYLFHLLDSYLSDPDRGVVKSSLEEEFGIKLSQIYRFDEKQDLSRIVHRILQGDYSIYNRYKENLPANIQNLIDNVCKINTVLKYGCRRCGTVHDNKPPECTECGNRQFENQEIKEILVDSEKLNKKILDGIQSCLSGPCSTERYTIKSSSYDLIEIGKSKCARSVLHIETNTGSESSTERKEYFFFPVVDGRKSQNIDKYLLNAVLVTAGESAFRNFDNLGTIDMIDLLFSKNSTNEIAKSILKSQKLLEQRILPHAYKSSENIEQLTSWNITDNLSEEDKKKYKEQYSAKAFEKDVFYIWKALFPMTERWGREGKSECDGCVIAAKSKGEYCVWTYDPKLNYDLKGYDLDSGEKNKAAYYILTTNNHKKLQQINGSQPVHAHIFVSNKFREGQFKHVMRKVEEWFMLVGGEKGISCNLVFMDAEALRQLHDFCRQHWQKFKDYADLRSRLLTELIEKFTPRREGYVHITKAVMDTVISVLTSEMATIKKKTTVQDAVTSTTR